MVAKYLTFVIQERNVVLTIIGVFRNDLTFMYNDDDDVITSKMSYLNFKMRNYLENN